MKKFIITLAVIFDTVSIIIGIIAGYYIRFYTILFTQKVPLVDINYYIATLIVLIPIWLITNLSLGLYRDIRVRHIIDEIFLIFGSGVISILITFGIAFFYRAFSYSRLVLILFFIIAVCLMCLFRALLNQIVYYFWKKGIGVRRTVIVGCGEISKIIVDKMRKGTGPYQLIGIASENQLLETEVNNFLKDIPKEYPYVGNLGDITMWAREKNVNELYITEEIEKGQLYELIKTSEKMNINLRIATDILGIMSSKVKADSQFGIPLFNLKRVQLTAFNKFIKRTLDIIISITGIIITSPILIIAAIIIRLTSEGPILYKQERVGLDNKPFIMYKLRSMFIDAEKYTGPVWSTKVNDPRRTPYGKFMRKFSIDELPQLFNVLKGDMSIVGPRPERRIFAERFSKEIPRYLERHKVKSGLTGWAQVNGLRGETSLSERIEYDIYYIENWSLLFDLKIVLLTFFNFISSEKF
jgi:exopolysaccharide biosynthesis polyprenyl glycosylphosphotransferase